MSQFATSDELADRLGVTFTTAEGDRADGLLERATGLVQAAAKQVIELVEDDELRLRGTRETTLLLPERPVTAIASVSIAGDTLDQDGFYLDEDQIVRAGGWGCLADELVIVYTHGRDPIPDAIKEITLGLAARAWVNPTGVVSERLGQAQMTYTVQDTAPGMLLTADERRAVRRICGRGSESLPIR